jgi:hypothetical protein
VRIVPLGAIQLFVGFQAEFSPKWVIGLAEEGAFYIPAVCYNFLEKWEPRGGLKRIHSRIKL